MVRYIEGDIVELIETGKYQRVLHGCNCFNTMGAGVAKALADRFPEIKEADTTTLKGDPSKLGDFTEAVCYIEAINKYIHIYNLYTQYRYGRQFKHFDEVAFIKVLRSIKLFINKDEHILMPRIGAGFAGAEWNIVYNIICCEFSDYANVFICLPN